jgi:hypothetical protein
VYCVEERVCRKEDGEHFVFCRFLLADTSETLVHRQRAPGRIIYVLSYLPDVV